MNQYYIIGNPINHSLSPILYKTAFEQLGIHNQNRYDPLPLDKQEIGSFIKKMKEGFIQGASVTIPYKEEIVSYVDDISNQVQLMKAANTLVLKDGKIHAYNTDGIGCIKSFEHAKISLTNRNVLVLGAGGAAKAIAISLLSEKISNLVIINRTLSRAEMLLDILNETCSQSITVGTYQDIKNIINDVEIIINATPVGMKGMLENKTPIDACLFHNELIVFDSVYTPKKTVLIKEAEKQHLKTIEGYNMLLFQFMEQFKLLINKQASFENCKNALLRQLG